MWVCYAEMSSKELSQSFWPIDWLCHGAVLSLCEGSAKTRVVFGGMHNFSTHYRKKRD